MSKHTPGPWKVTLSGGPDKSYRIESDERAIARVFGMSFEENRYTDACLIAAAPEMLHALKWWAGQIEENPDYARFKNLAFDRLLQVIAKAEGK
jgi:hypothetical protein